MWFNYILVTPEEQKRIMNGGNPQQPANAENGSCLIMQLVNYENWI